MFSLLFSSGMYGLGYMSEETKEIRDTLMGYLSSARSAVDDQRQAWHEKEMRASQHSIYMAHGVLGDDYKRLYGMIVDRRRANSLFPAHLFPLGEEGGVRVYHNLRRVEKVLDSMYQQYSINDQWSQWYWKWSLPVSNTFSKQILPSTSGGASTKKWQWDALDQRVFLSALRSNKHKDQLLLLSSIISRERNCGASEIQIETRNPSSWLHYINVWTPHGVDQSTGGTVHIEAIASIPREGGEGVLVHGSTFLSRGSPNESLMRVMLPRSSGSKWMFGLVLHKIADKPSIVKGVVESPKAKQSSHPFVGITAISPSTKWNVMVRAISRGTGKNIVGDVFNGMTGLEVRTDFKTKLSRHTFIRNKTYHYHGSSTAASPCLSVHSELTHEIPSRAVITTGVHSASITNGRGEVAVTKFGLHNSLYCDVYGFRVGLWGDWDLGGAHTVGTTLKL